MKILPTLLSSRMLRFLKVGYGLGSNAVPAASFALIAQGGGRLNTLRSYFGSSLPYLRLFMQQDV